MKAGELVEKLTIPKELEDWKDLTIEERFQREIDYTRVRKHIAPYLANDEDRFFGSLIVDIYNAGDLVFEPLSEVVKGLPGLYAVPGKAFGFLTFGGGEVLVPLDGQHRLAAMRFAISGKDEKQRDIEGLTPSFQVAQDDVSVIFVIHDEKKARKIFNKVNRYAKATSKAENLITADDDIVAVLTRGTVSMIIGERVINYTSNTLTPKAIYFTTLSTLYDASMRILSETFGEKIDTTVLPPVAKQQVYQQELERVWDKLSSGIEVFKAALMDVSEAGDERRQEIRRENLLGKPVVQLSLVIAFMRLWSASQSDGAKINEDEICDRLNKIDWRAANPLWQRVLMNGDKVVAGRQAANFAGRFVAYLAGEPLEEVGKNALEENYKILFPADERAQIDLPKV